MKSLVAKLVAFFVLVTSLAWAGHLHPTQEAHAAAVTAVQAAVQDAAASGALSAGYTYDHCDHIASHLLGQPMTNPRVDVRNSEHWSTHPQHAPLPALTEPPYQPPQSRLT